MKFFNRVRVFSTTNSGDVAASLSIALGSAFNETFLTPSEAGAVNTDVTSIIIEQSTDFAICAVTIGASATSCVVNSVLKTKVGGTVGGTLTLDGTQVIRFAETAEDLNAMLRVDVAQSFTAAQQAQGRANVYAAPFDALAYNGMQVNGSMEVNQEKGTALITAPADADCLMDGFLLGIVGTMVVNAQQVADAPAGLTNSLKITVTTAQSSLGANDLLLVTTRIEGFRTSRLAFGTASAQPVSFGFWVKANRTGAYSGSLRNNASNRAYPFSFTINAADTWEFKTVTVAGDTSGTWIGNTDGIGLRFTVAIAAGTSIVGAADAWAGAAYRGVTGTTNGVAATSDTFQITGLIVLPGIELPSSTRLPLILRPFHDELRLCRRYWRSVDSLVGKAPSTTQCFFAWSPETEMRATPSVAALSTTISITDINLSNYVASGGSVGTTSALTKNGGLIRLDGYTGLTAGSTYIINNTGPAISLNARL